MRVVEHFDGSLGLGLGCRLIGFGRGGQCLIRCGLGGGGGFHGLGGGGGFGLSRFLFLGHQFIQRCLGIGHGFLAHGDGGGEGGLIGLSFADLIKDGFVSSFGSAGCGRFFIHDFLSGSELLGHGGGVQGEATDLLTISGVPHINLAGPIGANHAFGIMSGNAGGGDITGEGEAALGVAAGIPEGGAAVAAHGDQIAGLRPTQTRRAAAVGGPALKLGDFINVPKFAGAIFTDAGDDVGTYPFEAGDTTAVAHERGNPAAGLGFPHMNATGSVAGGNIFSLRPKPHGGYPVGVFFDFMQHLAGVCGENAH